MELPESLGDTALTSLTLENNPINATIARFFEYGDSYCAHLCAFLRFRKATRLSPIHSRALFVGREPSPSQRAAFHKRAVGTQRAPRSKGNRGILHGELRIAT